MDRYHGTGEVIINRKGAWSSKEVIFQAEVIGVEVDPKSGLERETRRFKIHYGKNGTHVVPTKENENGLQ